jgi:choline dehydrogenase-like flavoprotein
MALTAPSKSPPRMTLPLRPLTSSRRLFGQVFSKNRSVLVGSRLKWSARAALLTPPPPHKDTPATTTSMAPLSSALASSNASFRAAAPAPQRPLPTSPTSPPLSLSDPRTASSKSRHCPQRARPKNYLRAVAHRSPRRRRRAGRSKSQRPPTHVTRAPPDRRLVQSICYFLTPPSAGAFSTPQLLLLSGVGAPQELAGVGVECVVPSPLVGRNLTDHVYVPLEFRSNVPGATLDEHSLPLLSTVAKYIKARRGPLTSNVRSIT